MKKSSLFFALLIGIFFITACSTTKRYIEIQEADYLAEYGRKTYELNKGDVLQVIQIKPCRFNYYLTCWKVRNVQTGDTGYVVADRMEEKHRVYIEEEKQ